MLINNLNFNKKSTKNPNNIIIPASSRDAGAAALDNSGFSKSLLLLSPHVAVHKNILFGARPKNGVFSEKEFQQTINDEKYFRFKPDKYQISSARSIIQGNNLIVSAPTGTGKTQIAEYAIKTILDDHKKDRKVIYTSPLKALSNDHYRHFQELYGKENVGLIIGDRQENVNAPLLVMTTEVYRNMAASLNNHGQLDDVDTVIFDEFHFLGDKSRGRVWEESVLFSPQRKDLNLIALSATMGNSDELQKWFSSVRPNQTTDVVSVPPADRHVPLEFFLIHNPKGNKYKILTKILHKDVLNQKILDKWDNDRLNAEDKKQIINFASFLKKEQIYLINELKENNNINLDNLGADASSNKFNTIIEGIKENNLKKRGIPTIFEDPEFKGLFKSLIENKVKYRTKLGTQSTEDIGVVKLVTQEVNIGNIENLLKDDQLSEVQKSELSVFKKFVSKNLSSYAGELKDKKKHQSYIETLLGVYNSEKLDDDLLLKDFEEKIETKKSNLHENIRKLTTEIELNSNDNSKKREKQLKIDELEKISQAQNFLVFLSQKKPVKTQLLTKKQENELRINKLENLIIIKENVPTVELEQEIKKKKKEKELLKHTQNALNELTIQLNNKSIRKEDIIGDILDKEDSSRLLILFEQAFGNINDKLKTSSARITIKNRENKLSEKIKKLEKDLAKLQSQAKVEKNSEYTHPVNILNKTLNNVNGKTRKVEIKEFTDIVSNTLGYPEEDAKRLGLILASKEPKKTALESPVATTLNIRPYQVVEKLFKQEENNKDKFFPMIYFIFSKAECNRNVNYFLESHKTLLSDKKINGEKSEKEKVKDEIENFFHENPYIEKQYLKQKKNVEQGIKNGNNTYNYIEGLKHGVGVHHSGLLPPIKRLQEKLFREKLTKVVFSTETIAAGLNFPAKTVVFDSLKEPYGDFLTISANKFHQMSGRAGRRGKDKLGKVLIVNNMDDTTNIAAKLIKASADNLNSNFKLDYSSVLAMLHNNTHDKAIEKYNKSYFVFQHKLNPEEIKARELELATENNLIIKRLKSSYTLLKDGYKVFKQKAVNEKIKNKKGAVYSVMQDDPLCSVNKGTERFASFVKTQKFILANCVNNLSGYEYMQEPLSKKENSLDESKKQLLADLDNSIEIVSFLLKNRQEINKLKGLKLSEQEKITKLKTESLKKYNEALLNPILKANLPHTEDTEKENAAFIMKRSFLNPIFLNYRLQLLEQIKNYIQNPEEFEKAEIDREIAAKKLKGINAGFNSRLKVLTEIYDKIPDNRFNNEPFIEKNNSTYSLTNKGRAAATLNGVNQILATELIYGENALFNKLSPREIVAVTGCMIQGFSEERYGELTSSPDKNEELPEKITSALKLIGERKQNIEGFEYKNNIEDSETNFNTNLANAFYAYTNYNNSFDYVYNKLIDKSKVPGYMEGDFATHILENIDLMQQMQTALGKDNPDLRLKLQIGIDMLYKPPVSEMIKREPQSTHDLKARLQLPMGGVNNRQAFKQGVKDEKLEEMLDFSNVPNSKLIRGFLKKTFMTSPADMRAYSEALQHIYSPESITKISEKFKKIQEYIRLTREEHKTNDEISKEWGVEKKILENEYTDYATQSKAMEEIPMHMLENSGYVFEQVAFNEFKDRFKNKAAEVLKDKYDINPDENYLEKNVHIVNGVHFFANGKESEIGEADLLVYDTNLKKVLLVGEMKLSDKEEIVGTGFNKRYCNIEDLKKYGVNPKTKIKIRDKEVSLDKNAFNSNPEVYLIVTQGIHNRKQIELGENVLESAFDKLDIKVMSETLISHINDILFKED